MKTMVKKNSIGRKLYILFKDFRKLFLIILITIICNSIICFFQPLIRSFLFDKGIVEQNWKVITGSIAIMFIFWGLDTLNNYLQLYCSSKIKYITSYKIFSNGLNKIMRLPITILNEKGALTLIENLRMDANTISSIADKNTIVIISNLFGIFGGILGLFVINWKLTVLSISVMLLKISHIHFFAVYQKKTFKNYISARSKISSLMSDIVINTWNIKLWTLYGKIKSKMRNLIRCEMQSVLKSQVASETQTRINKGIDLFLDASIYFVGTLFFARKELSIGELMVFLSSVGLISVPIALLSFIKNEFAKIGPSIERVDDLMRQKEEMTVEAKKIHTVPLPRYISFLNVDYSCGESEILKNVSFRIKRGERIAIWGSNGSGKSTILKLLLRLDSPTKGEILFDSISVDYFNIDDYRNLFCVVPQENSFFEGSIEENLFLQNKKESLLYEEDIFRSIVSKSQETNKNMIANGSNFSGGERKKISLLRALLKRGEILVLDEATANYDLQSISEYEKKIEKWVCKYPFVIFITHRLEEIKFVDKIIVLKQGEIEKILDKKDFIEIYEDLYK